MVAVRIKELSHRYAKEWVVHDVSFDIDQFLSNFTDKNSISLYYNEKLEIEKKDY